MAEVKLDDFVVRLTAGGNTHHPTTEDLEWPKRTDVERLYKPDL